MGSQKVGHDWATFTFTTLSTLQLSILYQGDQPTWMVDISDHHPKLKTVTQIPQACISPSLVLGGNTRQGLRDSPESQMERFTGQGTICMEDHDPLNRPLGGWLRTQSGNPKAGYTGMGAGRRCKQVLGEAWGQGFLSQAKEEDSHRSNTRGVGTLVL